jgi:hypothetical protein
MPSEPRISVKFHGTSREIIYGDFLYLRPEAWVNISVVDDASVIFAARFPAILHPRPNTRFIPAGELAELLWQKPEDITGYIATKNDRSRRDYSYLLDPSLQEIITIVNPGGLH